MEAELIIVYDQEILKSQSFVDGGRVVLNLMSQLFLALVIRLSWSQKCYQIASFILELILFFELC